jgi:1-acyl-sn-glycerol-3-phosphate acyltransferase
MTDGDRPGGREPKSAGSRTPAAGSAFKVYRGGRRPRPGAGRAVPPGDVGERLAALERQVEEALAHHGGGSAAPGQPFVRTALDEALAVLAVLARLSLGDAVAAGARGTERRLRALGLLEGTATPVAEALLDTLRRYWWRVEVVGIEHVPARGRMLLVANRAPLFLPWDALMIATALRDHPRGLRAHPLVDDGPERHPLMESLLARLGVGRGTAAAVRAALGRDEPVIVFPEGPRACRKTIARRYRLASFGRGTFARLAIEAGAPIVPVAVIGAEEAEPVLARVELPALLGLPALRVTPTFPWLGLAGLAPLPTKWTLHVGEPLDVVAAHPGAEAAPAAVARLRDQVRERLQALALDGLRQRTGLFR